MEALESSAKTVEEAIELALAKLGLERSDVEVEVIHQGRSGILGLGAENARVKVVPLEHQTQPADLAATSKEILERLLSLMKTPASIEASGDDSEDSPLTLEISNTDSAILIGHRGRTLSALQFLVNFMVGRRLGRGVRVIIDVAGYRKRREEELRNMALRAAEMVKSTNRSITLEPMGPSERRVIHITLRDDPQVTTLSIGAGESRKVVISAEKPSDD